MNKQKIGNIGAVCFVVALVLIALAFLCMLVIGVGFVLGFDFDPSDFHYGIFLMWAALTMLLGLGGAVLMGIGDSEQNGCNGNGV